MQPLLLGLTLGLAAGVSPGPLLVLVVTAALRSGWRAGALAACAPLVSDAVVVGVTLLLLDQLPARALSVLALAGAVFVAWTGVQTIRESRTATLQVAAPDRRTETWRAVRQAGLVNLLSPHPWLFWATVLGPLTLTTWREAPTGALLLVGGFYLAIVGSKAAISVVVAQGRRWLTDRSYRRVLLGAGVLLLVAAVAMAVEFGPAALGLG
ncbi:LysE family translocator [Ornithinimicrobium panacihumi]|uniref:LysE family translocator n=1 Tax=Ornithinimicrobium panacihumi TaxID=2008449 RepID=UPI003F8984EC